MVLLFDEEMSFVLLVGECGSRVDTARWGADLRAIYGRQGIFNGGG